MIEFPWIKSYPDGVRWDAKITPGMLPELLDRAVAKWRDNPAIEFMGKSITYGTLGDLVEQAARGFQKLGVKPGVRVGLYLPNTPHYVISFFAILKAGGTVVNYSPLDAQKVLHHKIEDSETDILVTLDLASLYPMMRPFLGTTHLKTLVVGNIAEMTPHPEAVSGHLRSAKQLAEVEFGGNCLSFAQLIDNEGQVQDYPLGAPDETLAAVQYTGGTTGQAKGTLLTHANIWAACEQVVAGSTVIEEGSERILVVLPLFHVYAMVIDMMIGIRMGALMIMHARFDVQAVVKDLAEKKVTICPGVPTMFSAIVNAPGIENFDLKSLKFCASGGAPLPLEVQQRFERLTGCRLVEGWGMTETSSVGTLTPLDKERRPGSCGLPAPNIMVKFADLSDPSHYVPYGERGEICVSGPNVTKGYWKNEAATKDQITADGYLRTGDVGYMDADGYIYIIDRTKDMILCAGFNVYPRNIEEAIYEHPSVAEVSVIGIPDAYRGQSPKAFVKLKDGVAPVTLEELQAFLKPRLGKHEMIAELEILAELPKTLVGKLSKKELYERETRRRGDN